MSTKVRMWGSVGILSTILSFIILGVLGWSGVGTLYAYNNKVDVTYVKGQMETMNDSLREIVVLQHDRNVQTEKHELRIHYCEKNIEKCKEYINVP